MYIYIRINTYIYIRTLCGYIFAYARKCVFIFRVGPTAINFRTHPFVLGHVYIVHCVPHVIHLDLHQDA